MTTFKCPKCVNAQLTSYVVFLKPIGKFDVNNNMDEVTVYADTDGTIKWDSTKEVYAYICSKGHSDVVVKPDNV